MKFKKFDMIYKFSDIELLYIINSILLTKSILKRGREEEYYNFFKKENYDIYMYDLSVIIQRLSYKLDLTFFNNSLSGEEDYLTKFEYKYLNSSKDFSFLLKTRERKEFYKKIFSEIESLKFREKKKEKIKILENKDKEEKSRKKLFSYIYNKFLKNA